MKKVGLEAPVMRKIYLVLCVWMISLPGLHVWAIGARTERTLRDIPYAKQTHHKLTLDVYSPSRLQESQFLPVLIHVHGGGWFTGDKKLMKRHGLFYAGKGYIVVTPNYRLSPEIKHPVHVEDCALAVKWVFDHIHSYGGDPKQVYLSGHSAGAHLVALLATNPSYLEKQGIEVDQIKGVIPVDTASFDLTRKDNERFVQKLRARAFPSDMESLTSGSPLLQVKKGMQYPPFLIFASGNRQPAINQSQDLANKLKEAGGRAKVHVVEGYNHKDMNTGMFTPDDLISRSILEFLKHSVSVNS